MLIDPITFEPIQDIMFERNCDHQACAKCGADQGIICRSPACEANKIWIDPAIKVEAPVMVKPFSPAEVKKRREDGEGIHPMVIAAVNELLVENGGSRYITLTKKAVVKRALEKLNGKNGQSADESWPDRTYRSDDLYKNKWMDFEDAFRKAGWIVEYDAPGYNESYEATYQFRSTR